MKITKIIFAAVLAMCAFAAQAQDKDDDFDFPFENEDNDNGFHFTTDFVTKNTWRGMNVSDAAFQPELSYSIGGLRIGSWGSTALNSDDKYTELDFFLEYAVGGVSMMVYDYCWTDDNGKFDYFGKYKDTHLLEVGLGYDFGEICENFPVSFNVNTIVAGANRKANDDQAFSTYMEIVYAPSLKNLDLSFTVGAASEDEDAAMYSRKGGFNIVNIDFGLSHDFKIKDIATITAKADIIFNPTGSAGAEKGEAFITAGVGISF